MKTYSCFLFLLFGIVSHAQIPDDINEVKQLLSKKWQIVGIAIGIDTTVTYPNADADFVLDISESTTSDSSLHCITNDLGQHYSTDTLSVSYYPDFGWQLSHFPPVVLQSFDGIMYIDDYSNGILRLWDWADDGIYIWMREASSGLASAAAPSWPTVYPNPFSDFIAIDGYEKQVKMNLINVTTGQVIYRNITSNTIRTDDLATGMYALIMKNQQHTNVKKIMKW